MPRRLTPSGHLRPPSLRDSLGRTSNYLRIFDAAPEPKWFFAIPGAGHNDTYVTGGEPYWRAVKQFLESLQQGDEERTGRRQPNGG